MRPLPLTGLRDGLLCLPTPRPMTPRHLVHLERARESWKGLRRRLGGKGRRRKPKEERPKGEKRGNDGVFIGIKLLPAQGRLRSAFPRASSKSDLGKFQIGRHSCLPNQTSRKVESRYWAQGCWPSTFASRAKGRESLKLGARALVQRICAQT